MISDVESIRSSISKVNSGDCSGNVIYAKLLPSVLVSSVLGDGNCAPIKSQFDTGFKAFLANTHNSSTVRHSISGSMRCEYDITRRLLSLSAIKIDNSQLCPMYLPRSLLHKLFGIDFNLDPKHYETGVLNFSEWSGTGPVTPSATDSATVCSDGSDESTCSVFSMLTNSELKNSILPGYRDLAPCKNHFIREVVINRTKDFKDFYHRAFFDKYMATSMNVGKLTVVSQQSMIKNLEAKVYELFDSVTWLTFIRNMVPDQYKLTSESAYTYVNAHMVHSRAAVLKNFEQAAI